MAVLWHQFTVDECVDFIRENGDHKNKVIVKSDQESSIKYVVEGGRIKKMND